jgi:purine nucleosidase
VADNETGVHAELDIAPGGGASPACPATWWTAMKPASPISARRSWTDRLRIAAAAICAWALTASLAGAQRVPVLFDTDIGTDIDDAYALALILRSPELDLVGVTTVSGDAVARARLAAKLLATEGGPAATIPVYAGTSTATQYMKQTEWAAGFMSPALHTEGGVAFMRAQIEARPGQLTIIAVGELTNVAALLASSPGIAGKIKRIALMGGAVRRGGEPGSKPQPEWNIKSNAAAARAVFTAGVPLVVGPLDATADLKLTPEHRVRLFTRGTPLTDALGALDYLWTHTNTWKGTTPILFDLLPIAALYEPGIATFESLHVEVEADGLTREVAGLPANAQVALTSDPVKVVDYLTARLAR